MIVRHLSSLIHDLPSVQVRTVPGCSNPPARVRALDRCYGGGVIVFYGSIAARKRRASRVFPVI